MKIKIAVLVTAFSVMLTGCGAINDEPVGVTAPAAEVMSEETRETAETSVQTQAPETAQETAETTAQLSEPDPEPPSEEDDKVTVIYDRPDPEIEVSAEEFEEYMKKLGYSLCVPDGAEKVTYITDTDYPAARMDFYLNGVEWSAGVRKVDKTFYAPHPYVDEYMTAIDCDLESGQVMNVHGVEGDIWYYKISFSDGAADRYKLETEWYLQEDGLAVGLTGWSDEPIHKIPVEALG